MSRTIPKMGTRVNGLHPNLGSDVEVVPRAQFPTMGTNNLKVLRQARGWTLEEAATELGMSRSGYQKVERGERRLTLERITKAAAVYKVSPSALTEGESWTKVVGSVEAGGIVRLVDDANLQLSVRSPPESSESTRGLEVKGGALPGIAEAHWLVFYDDVVKGLPDDRIGALCVIAVEGGTVVRIGRVYNGSRPGTYDVAPAGFETVKGLQIEWSARITWIKPR